MERKSSLYILIIICFLLWSSCGSADLLDTDQAKLQQAGHFDECKGLKSIKQSRAYSVATFDSGFGGFFTAKAIEEQARFLSQNGYGPFTITHYADTKNLPYGDKAPEEIARLTSAGVLTAFRDGARDVFIACNTASTQVEHVRDIIRAANRSYPNHTYSIIEVSVAEVMKTVSQQLKIQDRAVVAVLATPATVLSETYPKALAKAMHNEFKPGKFKKITQPRWLKTKDGTVDSYAYVTQLVLGPRKKVIVYQFAPGNWVELIEHCASVEDKLTHVRSDLRTLMGELEVRDTFDAVGEFCTHYPVIDAMIRNELKSTGKADSNTHFIVQGPLMGQLFKKRYLSKHPARSVHPVAPPSTPHIYLSGTNIEATGKLVRTMFPNDPIPVIETKKIWKTFLMDDLCPHMN